MSLLQVLTTADIQSNSRPDGRNDVSEPHDLWRPAPLTLDTWSFTPDNTTTIRIPPHNYLASHLAALQLNSLRPVTPTTDTSDLSLNPGLAGVRTIQEAIVGYEKATGFHYTIFPDIDHADFGYPPPLNLVASEDDIVEANKAWSDSLTEFITASLADTEEYLSSSFIESEHSSGSDNSTEFFAMPSTPVLKGGHLADVLVKSANSSVSFGSPGIDDALSTPAKTLNKFASSFVPSFSSPPAQTGTFSFTSKKKSVNKGDALPSLSSFTFPTLNPPTQSTARLTTVKIKKDDQGFFTDVQLDNPTGSGSTNGSSNKSTDHALLPPFLQEPAPRRRPRVSRTREIVDRLRSSQSTLPTTSISNFTLEDTNLDANASINGSLSAGTDKNGSGTSNSSFDFTFDLQPKSASLCPSPNIQEGSACVRPRSSVSDDASRGRDGAFDEKKYSPDEVEDSKNGSDDIDDGDDDGWIDLARTATKPAAANANKVKRARDLFLALTRRRTDSTSSEPTQEVTAASTPSSSAASLKGKVTLGGESYHRYQLSLDGVEHEGKVKATTASATTTSSTKPPRYAASRDGWIDGAVSTPASTVAMGSAKVLQAASSSASGSTSASTTTTSSSSSPAPSMSQASKSASTAATTPSTSSSSHHHKSATSHRKKTSSRSTTSGGSVGGSSFALPNTHTHTSNLSAGSAAATYMSLNIVPPNPLMNPVGIMSAPLHPPQPFFYGPGVSTASAGATAGYHPYPHAAPHHMHPQHQHLQHPQYPYLQQQQQGVGMMGMGMPVPYAPVVGYGYGAAYGAGLPPVLGSAAAGSSAQGGHRKGGSVSAW